FVADTKSNSPMIRARATGYCDGGAVLNIRAGPVTTLAVESAVQNVAGSVGSPAVTGKVAGEFRDWNSVQTARHVTLSSSAPRRPPARSDAVARRTGHASAERVRRSVVERRPLRARLRDRARRRRQDRRRDRSQARPQGRAQAAARRRRQGAPRTRGARART